MKVFTDGGSRGNPGPSACAWVVYDGDNIVKTGSEFIGISTNNQAEYKAVYYALNWIKNNIKDDLSFYLDSELVVKQLNGVYKIKDANLKALAIKIKTLIASLPQQIAFSAVRREQNKLADKLVNEKLDEHSKV